MEKNPISKVLDQIAEIMQLLYDNSDKKISPEHAEKVEKQLDELKKKVEIFKKKGEEFSKEWGSSDYVLKSLLEGKDPSIFAAEQIEALNKAEILKTEAEKAAKDIKKASSEQKAAGTTLTKKAAKSEK